MPAIFDTAYPRLGTETSSRELIELFTASPRERRFVASIARQVSKQIVLLAQLKVMQRLGYAIPVVDIPRDILDHIAGHLKGQIPGRLALGRYDASGSKSRHLKQFRDFLQISPLGNADRLWLDWIAYTAAKSKHEIADIINVMIEELMRHRYELPTLAVLTRMAKQARSRFHEEIYRAIADALPLASRQRIEELLTTRGGKAFWDQIKREPKQAKLREITDYLRHFQAVSTLCDGLPANIDLPATKRGHWVIEARALDIAEMRALKPAKRYALAVLLIQAQQQKALDDIAEMFIKSVRHMHSLAKERLNDHILSRTQQTEAAIDQFRQLLSVMQGDSTPQRQLSRMRNLLGDDIDTWLTRCDELMAYAGKNHLPFLLKPYRAKRGMFFQCLDALTLHSSSADTSLLQAIEWMQSIRSSHKEWLEISLADVRRLKLDQVGEKWRPLIIAKAIPRPRYRLIHRKYAELCLFTQIFQELRSGDLYVEGSDEYDDARKQLVEMETVRKDAADYCDLVGLPANARSFVKALRNDLQSTAQTVDEAFPENESLTITEAGLTLRRAGAEAAPDQLDAIDAAITETMDEVNILDLLAEAEQWLDLHRLFGPLSGFEPKIHDARRRFIVSLFCYGCNIGPTQTARSIQGLSRKQVAWLDLHHITEERLDKAIVKVINAYKRFALPRYWGDGSAVAADGTKWSMYEKNLLSEYHIRYGGYGGIGYYHVSDTYIALFSHFIPCGVYEAVYILDGLLKNTSDIQPDKIHGDTQAQNLPAFALSYLLGIKLMPRIRQIKNLDFCRPDAKARFQHIDALFTKNIDWDLIERHYEDLLQVAISIQQGKITPSAILRRLGTASRKNRLYYAFKELGKVVRTKFLLQYISSIELRKTINAATNKNEEFNGFIKWLFFGGDGIIAENIRHEQRKVVKYNHLVANMVILHNVQTMSRKLKDLQNCGYVIDDSVLRALSPYRTSHINRFGDYKLDLERPTPPMDFEIEFD
ncbi:Tn3 family transposase [Cupriavidus metallidurans]|uniref:Tn3 family transposase n=1 Tax=Cupriavidus metallidurans TaxID=119219 RepID=UPI001CCD7A02|nr:Tn3 family transposase [Cupriavidus metallidurans]UBM07931.1 Tn3 family transposase [Cupriavidus metallidurans]